MVEASDGRSTYDSIIYESEEKSSKTNLMLKDTIQMLKSTRNKEVGHVTLHTLEIPMIYIEY